MCSAELSKSRNFGCAQIALVRPPSGLQDALERRPSALQAQLGPHLALQNAVQVPSKRNLDPTWPFKMTSKRNLDSTWCFKLASKRNLDSTWRFKLPFQSAPDLQKPRFSLGKPYFLQGGLVCCASALGLLFRSSAGALGRFWGVLWRLLGCTWALLAASGALQDALERRPSDLQVQLGPHLTLENGLQAQLGLHLVLQPALQVQLGLHLALQTALPERS